MNIDNILMDIKKEVEERIRDAEELTNSEMDNFKSGYCSGVKDSTIKIKEIIEQYERIERRKAI